MLGRKLSYDEDMEARLEAVRPYNPHAGRGRGKGHWVKGRAGHHPRGPKIDRTARKAAFRAYLANHPEITWKQKPAAWRAFVAQYSGGLKGVDFPQDAGSDDQSLPGEARINQFNEWLANEYPEKYAVLKMQHPELFQYRSDATGFYGMGAEPIQSTEPPNKWFSLANDALKTVFTYKTQQQILKYNLDRAQRGQPPVDVSQITPTLKVEGGLDTKTLLLAGAGLLAVLFLFKRR